MKKTIAFITVLLVFISCKNKEVKDVESNSNQATSQVVDSYKSFGDAITSTDVITKEELFDKYSSLKQGDTLTVKYASKINAVCKKKGCWMKNDLGEGNEVMVRFKDYGFFMPLNSEGHDVIVEGKAYITEISVEELQHYAKDAGKSEEEITAINSPEITYAFESNGVLLK